MTYTITRFFNVFKDCMSRAYVAIEDAHRLRNEIRNDFLGTLQLTIDPDTLKVETEWHDVPEKPKVLWAVYIKGDGCAATFDDEVKALSYIKHFADFDSAYASPIPIFKRLEHFQNEISFRDPWPWTTHSRGRECRSFTEWHKEGKSRRRQLVIAAALLLAEIERLDRQEARDAS